MAALALAFTVTCGTLGVNPETAVIKNPALNATDGSGILLDVNGAPVCLSIK